MDIKRTKEILGEDIKDLNDDQILLLIKDRSRLCDILIDLFDNELLTDDTCKNKNAGK